MWSYKSHWCYWRFRLKVEWINIRMWMSKRFELFTCLTRTIFVLMKYEQGWVTLSDLMYSHYNDVIMSTMGSQITSPTIVYSIVYSGTDQRKHQSCASLVCGWGIHRWSVNSPHKGPATRKMFPFDDVIMVPPSNCAVANRIYVHSWVTTILGSAVM